MKINIYKRKNSQHWQISFSIAGNLFRFSSQSTLKKHAEALGKKIFDEKYNEIVLGNKKFNLFAVLDYYMNSGAMGGFSNARKSQNSLTIKLLIEFFENKEFNQQNYYIFLNTIKIQRDLSDNSLKKYIQSTNAIINYGISKGFIASNPLDKLNKSHLARDVSRIRFLSKDEYDRLNKAILLNKNDLKDYFLFAMNSGLRLGEQLGLAWDRIDFNNGEIYIIETKTKTNRTIPINAVLSDILKSRIGLEKPFGVSKSTLNGWWIEALKLAKIDNFRWHDLRHTFASWCIKGWFAWQKEAYDLYRLSKLLGHSDVGMTTKYAHLQIGDLKQNIKDF